MSILNLIVASCNFLAIFWLQIGFVEAIAGGRPAIPGQFKFVVSVQADNEHICGGAIIDETYVLTAAQCMIGEDNKFKNKKFTIVGGAVNLATGYPHTILASVEVIYVPLEYSPINPNPENIRFKETGDLAVLRLNTKLLLGQRYAIDKLNFPERVARSFIRYYDREPIFIGFGGGVAIERSTSDMEVIRKDNKIGELKFIQTNVKHKRVCRNAYPFSFDEKLMCAQVKKHPLSRISGPCYGDIGSPLVLDNNTIIGLLIEHDVECRENPNLYTRISSFTPFIKKILNHTNKISHLKARIASYVNERRMFGSYQPNAQLEELDSAVDKLNAIYTKAFD